MRSPQVCLQLVTAICRNYETELAEFVDSTTPLIPESETSRETQPTLGFRRVLQRAVFHVQSSGKREVTGANAGAIFSEQESQAVFLEQQDIARIDVVNYITHGISRSPAKAKAASQRRTSRKKEILQKIELARSKALPTNRTKPEELTLDWPT